MPDDELTPEEREAFAALPRETAPDSLLEERIVARLRARGVLRPARRRGLVLSPAWISVAAAAAVVLVAGAFVMGQATGTRRAMDLVQVVERENGKQLALVVQQAGSAYVDALNALAQTSSPDSAAVRQGREAAMAALFAASYKIATLAPDEPVARGILQALADDPNRQTETRDPARFIWF
jgi:hypothetical protein